MRVYVAASWRTAAQPLVVQLLREDGYDVYDFRQDGFSWREIDDAWRTWTPEQIVAAYQHPRAQQGFKRDYLAMTRAHAGVLLQPSGRSAHLELGWMAGRGKYTVVLLDEHQEPDLMYLMAHDVCVSVDAVRAKLRGYAEVLGL